METFRLDLDLDKSPRIGARVRVRQGDKESCVVEASVFDSGAQADLSGKSARFCCLKPDRTMVRDASCKVSGSAITYTLDQQVSAASGVIELAYFEVLDASGAVIDSTQAFTIEVEEGAEAGSSGVSEDYFSELDDLIARYEQAIQQSQSDYEAAEASRNQSFQQAQAQRQTDYEQAEAARDAAQDANDAKQTENDSAQAKNNADQALNNQAAQGLQVVILADGQYDPETRDPTVEGAVGKLYFVPTGEADEEDAYVEWMWVSGAWERVGMSNATIEAVSTDQVDSVVADASPQGEQVLNLTGLSYLWAKLKSWATSAFAALTHQHSAADVTSGTLAADRLPVVPVTKGGTGATSASAALMALGAASASELNDVRDSLSQVVTEAYGSVGGTGFESYASLIMIRFGGSVTVTIGFRAVGNGGSSDWVAVDMDRVFSLLGVPGATVEERYVPLAVADQSDQDQFGGLSGLLMTRNGQIGRRYGDEVTYGSWPSTSDLYKNGGLCATCTFHIVLPMKS